MFRNKQATSNLVSGSLILISFSLHCTFFAPVSSTANSSMSVYSNSVKSEKERQFLNLSESSTNLTTKRPTTDNITTTATTTQFRFLNDNGELPELTNDDNDNDDVLQSATAEPTTMKTLVHHHANEVKESLYQANPATTRIPNYVDNNAQALGQEILDEFESSGETSDPSTPISTTATTPTTTTTIATTTYQPITATKPPDFDTVTTVNMGYSLLILTPFVDELKNSSSQAYTELEEDVVASVNLAFAGCPGFKTDSAKVKGFQPSTAQSSSGKSVLGNPSSLAVEGQTVADYNVSFDSATVYAQEDEIVEYITNNVTWNLESTGVGGHNVSADGMVESTKIYMSDPCVLMTSAICSTCYLCTGYGNMKSLGCHYGCDRLTQLCTITENIEDVWKFECTCLPGYLPMAGECADADVIIGVSVAIASALLIGLIIAIIILCRKLSRKDKDSENSLSGLSPHPYETPGLHEPFGPSPEPTEYPGPLLLPLSPYVEPELSASPEPISAGEIMAVQKLEAAAPEPTPLTRSEVVVHEHSEDRNEQPLAAIALERNRLYDYDDERDLPPEIAHSTVFRNFIPSLKNIEPDDLGREFAIARPRLSLSPFEVERDVSYNNETFF